MHIFYLAMMDRDNIEGSTDYLEIGTIRKNIKERQVRGKWRNDQRLHVMPPVSDQPEQKELLHPPPPHHPHKFQKSNPLREAEWASC